MIPVLTLSDPLENGIATQLVPLPGGINFNDIKKHSEQKIIINGNWSKKQLKWLDYCLEKMFSCTDMIIMKWMILGYLI